MSTIFGWDVVWKSAFILGCAGLAALALRRAPAATRHLVWSLGTAGSLVLPLLALAVPAWTWAVFPPSGGVSLTPVNGLRAAAIARPSSALPASIVS